jgi:hypothetical protein
MLRKLIVVVALLSAGFCTPVVMAKSITIKSDHQTVARINTDLLRVEYLDGGSFKRLQGRCKQSKCRFQDGQNELVAEVKYYDDKVKLRTRVPSSEIKFKARGDKWKVIINGDEENSLEIKKKGDKLKLYKVDAGARTEVGKIQVAQDYGSLKIKNADKQTRYRIDDTLLRPVYGVLLDDRLHPLQRYVLIVALLYRHLP